MKLYPGYPPKLTEERMILIGTSAGADDLTPSCKDICGTEGGRPYRKNKNYHASAFVQLAVLIKVICFALAIKL